MNPNLFLKSPRIESMFVGPIARLSTPFLGQIIERIGLFEVKFAGQSSSLFRAIDVLIIFTIILSKAKNQLFRF